MGIDEATGQILDDEDDDQVVPIRRPPRAGARRTSLSGTTTSASDDSKTILSQARIIEVEGATDRLGVGVLNQTLNMSEERSRRLMSDLSRLRDSHEEELGRTRDEYERAADAAESRHAREAVAWRSERDRLRLEIQRLEAEAKDLQKSKKKHKRRVADLTIKIEELRESGLTKRALVGGLAQGVPPLAEKLAEHLPDILSFFTSFGIKSASVSKDEATKDRAAAIRFVGRLFDPKNEELLEDLKRQAEDVVDQDGQAVIVSEWDRIVRYVTAAIQRDAEREVPGAS
jgi:chromosome segregation ATPase